ncbi:MAG: HEAT repeat domain-containing protein [Ardenticatenaceae bacterium]|nr:HEAT repeat domain-containing protein [Ardenticatenaceae bacterium]
MKSKDERFWTLDDYRRWLNHPDAVVREWAAHRIDNQYPQQAAESFVGLLNDSSIHLRTLAAQTLAVSGDPGYEPALLAALPQSEGLVRRWIVSALAQLHSPALLPQLLEAVDAAGELSQRDVLPSELGTTINALGHYPDAEARAVLWRFVERYTRDDSLSQDAFSALLRFPDVDTVPRLVERYQELRLNEPVPWVRASLALAEAAGLSRMTEEATGAVQKGPDAARERIEDWLNQSLSMSERLDNAISTSYQTTTQAATTLLPLLATEIADIAAERGDDLAAWQAAWAAGERPGGYRRRMLYASQLVSTLAAHPPTNEERAQPVLGLSLAVTAQVLTDQNDEAALEGAPDEATRREVLLDILSSPRQNVLPDIVDRVAALGPNVVPDLAEILEEGPFWALPRTLQTIGRVARAHPGAADAIVPDVLGLIQEDESDYVLEAAGETLVAIGPAVVTPAAEGLHQGDHAYDTYVTGALSDIPTEASVDALLEHVAVVGLDDWGAEMLGALGNGRAIPVLQESYRPGDQLLGQFLYVLGVLNGYTGPEMDEWRAEALAAHERFERALTGDFPPLFESPPSRAEPELAPAPTRPKTTSADKQRKKRRAQAKASRKAQRKQKKKKKKRR